jgi:HK97 family phage major capsid protein
MPVDGITRADAEALYSDVLSAELITMLPRQSAVLQALTVVPMGTRVERMPVLDALPTAAFLNADQAPKPLTEISWKNKQIVAEEIAVIVPFSENVLADTSVDIQGRVTQLIVQEFGRVLDAAVLFGTGAPASYPVGGIVGNAVKVAKGTKGIADDLNNLFAQVELTGHDVTDFFATRALRAQLRGQTGLNGAPIYIPSEGNANVGSVYGINAMYPLGWDKAKATSIAIDDSSAIIGLRSDVKIKVLTEASLTGFGNLAERDSIAIRAVMRVGFTVAEPVSIDNPTAVLPFAYLL